MRYVCPVSVRQRIAVLLFPLGFVLLLGLGAACAYAQGTHADAELSLEEPLRNGVHALEEERLARAESLLVEVFDTQPNYISPEHGAAAYWLGTAYEQQDETEQAHETWIEGQRAVADTDAFDVRLADAYLRALFATDLNKQRLEAADVYLQLLGHADSSLASDEDEIVHRHVAQSALLMNEEKRAELSDDSLHDETWSVKEGAGDHLTSWWQRQDRAPATPENERLEEHLQRVAKAEAEYPHEERVSGLDDRGETYVRYGPPYKEHSISYNDMDFQKEVFRFGVNVASFDFPKNEVWTYPHIHRAAYFVFVEEKNGIFKIGRSGDLLPNRLSNTFSNSERHLNRSVSALAAMQHIYRDLALYHPDFGSLYDDVADYANWQEMNAKSYQATGEAPPGTVAQRVGSGAGQERMVFSSPTFGIDQPSQFVQRKAQEQKTVDYHAERARNQALPQQHSEIFDEVDSLSLDVRTARFLEPNGKTRTEVYWGTFTGNLELRDEDAEKDSRVKLTAVQYDQNYERKHAANTWYDTSVPPGEEGLVVPDVFSVNNTLDVYHLALQWEQYTTEGDGDNARLGKQQRVATHHVDTLTALNADGRELEMSDLRPMLPNDASAPQEATSETAALYPFDIIDPEAPLLLYFELYHLGFDGDDRTQYTVEYDVHRRTDRHSPLGRLFRGDDEQRTAGSTTYEGDSRTSQEEILIDLSDWDNERVGEIVVTVRVTDETTDHQVERAISFDVVPGS